MANPSDVARYGKDQGLFLYNNTSTITEIWCDRVQRVDPEANMPLNKLYELGRIGPVGSVTDPSTFRVTITENMHNSEIDSYMAGKTPATSGSLFNIGEVLANSLRASLVTRSPGSDDPDGEFVVDNAVVESISYVFQIRGPCTCSYSLKGRTGRFYTSGSLLHATWGTLDDSAPAGVNGRDAQIFFTSDSNKAYRLQRFAINVRFPATDVGELGTRDLAGTVQDSPDVTLDFDVLHADAQPHDEWATLTAGYYDFNNPLQPDVWIKVYSPDDTEGNTLIKTFKIENVRAATARPMSAQVRGLATTRYSLSSIKEDTAGEGGMYVSTAAIA